MTIIVGGELDNYPEMPKPTPQNTQPKIKFNNQQSFDIM